MKHQSFRERFNGYQDFFLYGVSAHAKEVHDFLGFHGRNVIAYVDKDPKKRRHNIAGAPVISPDDLLDNLEENAAIIIVSAFIQEIFNYLKLNAVHENRIFPLLDGMFFPTYCAGYVNNTTLDEISLLLSPDERLYFDSWRVFKETGNIGLLRPVMSESGFQYDHKQWLVSMREGQVCLDVGAFDGTTAIHLLETGHFSKVISFEPFDTNYRQLCSNIEKHEIASQITPIRIALGSTNREFFVEPQELSSRSRTSEENRSSGERIQERTLDSYGFESISMIKVDIEGAEIEFLRGGKETIMRNKPHLAISAYHHKSHPDQIFEFMKSLDLPFRLNVGHHPHAQYELEYYFSFTD